MEGVVVVKKIILIFCILMAGLLLFMAGQIITTKIIEQGSTVVARDNYLLIDGVYFTKDKTTLVYYPSTRPGENYTIPSYVTKIWGNAFIEAKYLKNVIVPANVKKLGNEAFHQRLKSIKFLGDMPTLGYVPELEGIKNKEDQLNYIAGGSRQLIYHDDPASGHEPIIYFYDGFEGFTADATHIKLFSIRSLMTILFGLFLIGTIVILKKRNKIYFKRSIQTWHENYKASPNVLNVKNLSKAQAYSVFLACTYTTLSPYNCAF